MASVHLTANLAEASASEEDEIKALVIQSCHEYDPIKEVYMKKPLGPPGHYIKNCLTNGDKKFETVPRIKKSTGIPQSFMTEMPNTKGAMLTNTEKISYARGKKEKPPFLPEEPSFSSFSSDDPVPDELSYVISKDLMTDAAVIPCCGNSSCDKCIRTALLESEEHTCPTWHQTDVSPDALIANKCFHQAICNKPKGKKILIYISLSKA
uniref:Uncharacterized protein n=1 Tax=Aquila chrysaetos chrysaetos TaxID=223781 RepID=A0A663F4P4_AQUCH